MTDYPFNANKPVKADTIANFCVYTEQNAEHIYRALFGFVRRPKFRWKDADEIYIGPGCYHHAGSTRDRLVWWNSEITFALGSGGSNALSDDLGNNQWHYIFIDDSAVNTAATNELVAACFLNDTTAPTWSDAKHGWYTGNDRCIFAVRTSGAGAVLEFFHDGGELVSFADLISETSGVGPSTTWTDCDMATSVPGFSTKAQCQFSQSYVDADVYIYWRTNGQSGTSGHVLFWVSSSQIYNASSTVVITDSSQIIEFKLSGAASNTVSINVDGWYFPVGM